MDPETVVRAFCALMPTGALDRLRPMLTDDVVYHNIPMEPAVGLDATLAAIDLFFSMFEGVEFRITALAADGPRVLTERVDVFALGGRVAELPVMGIFEVRDGRIAAWRDYFDMGQVTAMLAGG